MADEDGEDIVNFFEQLLGGPPNRPKHPDMMKLSDILLRHDGPTTDPTTMEHFSMEDRIAQEINPQVLTYTSMSRGSIYIGEVEKQLGVKLDPAMMVAIAGTWVDAFMVGVEWQKAKNAAADQG